MNTNILRAPTRVFALVLQALAIELLALAVVQMSLGEAAGAASINPDISLIGQPAMRWSDDAADPARKRARLEVGETEIVFDAPLNPYARGTAVITLGDEGAEVEEAFFALSRGLPGALALKGGKYRSGFGRLNIAHGHTYPFAERFRVLAAYLPGDESLNETGLQLSELIALPGDCSLTASADWLQGDSFRIERSSSGATNDPLAAAAEGDRAGEPRPAGLARLAGFVPIGDRSGLEMGVSALRGTNNVAAATRTTVFGGDFKVKFWNSARSYFLVQGEFLGLDREDAAWDSLTASHTSSAVKPAGGYVFADCNFGARYNVGASFESHQQAAAGLIRDQALGIFAGLALMEETTLFRLAWERFTPGAPAGAPAPDAVNTISLRVVYSMGPHKTHKF
ncbi:MAG: hypothetical protein ABIS67_06490 [Candidatus Eisenbacteria bacterium]